MWVSFVCLLTVRLYNYLDYNANLYTFRLFLYIMIKIKKKKYFHKYKEWRKAPKLPCVRNLNIVTFDLCPNYYLWKKVNKFLAYSDVDWCPRPQ